MSCIKEIPNFALIIYYFFSLRSKLTILCLSVCHDPPHWLPSSPPAHGSLLAQPGGTFPHWSGGGGELGQWRLLAGGTVRREVLQAPPPAQVMAGSAVPLLQKGQGKIKLKLWYCNLVNCEAMCREGWRWWLMMEPRSSLTRWSLIPLSPPSGWEATGKTTLRASPGTWTGAISVKVMTTLSIWGNRFPSLLSLYLYKWTRV